MTIEDLASIRRAFNLGYRAGKIQRVPCFPRLKESAPRQGFVEETDYAKLAANARALWLRAMLATAYTFGFRKSELLEMKVPQIDLVARTISLKSGRDKKWEGRTVRMTADVFTLLVASVSGKKPIDCVFTHRDGSPILDFRGARETLTKSAGRPGLLFHDLRRSAVRNMVRRGIPEVVAMRISGHKTREVFNRYNIVSESDLVEAARKIEAGKTERAYFGHDSGVTGVGSQTENAISHFN